MSLDEELSREEGKIIEHPFLWMLTATSVIPLDYVIQTYMVPLLDLVYK